jgi:hypothetical protein
MTEKSFVTMETKACVICGLEYSTGAILLDRRLQNTFDENTCTGWGICEEHKLATERDGMIGLIEIDASKSDKDESGNKVSIDGAHRTGRVALMKRDQLQDMCAIKLPNTPFLFLDIDAFEKLMPPEVWDDAAYEPERVPGSFTAPGSDLIN